MNPKRHQARFSVNGMEMTPGQAEAVRRLAKLIIAASNRRNHTTLVVQIDNRCVHIRETTPAGRVDL